MIHSEFINGREIQVWHDELSDSPRGDCNLGVMALLHNRYNLPYEHKETTAREMLFVDHWAGVLECIKNDVRNSGDEVVEILKVYMIDHSGTHFSTGDSDPFSHLYMGWDSGCVGFIYATRKGILESFNVKRITKDVREAVHKILESEVKIYGQWSNGEVYYFDVMDEDGETIDSCGGYYSVEEAVEAAKEMILETA